MIASSKIFALFLLFFLFTCAPKKEVYYESLEGGRMVRYKEIGIASWYGKEYHGRKTANGETYDMFAMTAAHLTLPFNSRVRVTNIENGKQVDLRINDRGPFVAGRIIDLSYTGAKAIDMLGRGTAKVAVETTLPAGGGSLSIEGIFAIQVGAFEEKQNADRFQIQLQKTYANVHTVMWESNMRRLYRVRLGAFRTEEEARRYLEVLKKEDLSGFVVRED